MNSATRGDSKERQERQASAAKTKQKERQRTPTICLARSIRADSPATIPRAQSFPLQICRKLWQRPRGILPCGRREGLGGQVAFASCRTSPIPLIRARRIPHRLVAVGIPRVRPVAARCVSSRQPVRPHVARAAAAAGRRCPAPRAAAIAHRRRGAPEQLGGKKCQGQLFRFAEGVE